MNVAIIGSREISERTGMLIEILGEFVVQNGWNINSGNAIGVDRRAAIGGNRIDSSAVTIYQPWPSYNADQLVWGNNVVLKHDPGWKDVARRNHVKYDSLTQGAQKMMDRNSGIILNSDVVLAVLNHQKIGFGGTGHGWRISKELDLPRIDLAQIENDKPSLEQVKEFLIQTNKRYLAS